MYMKAMRLKKEGRTSFVWSGDIMFSFTAIGVAFHSPGNAQWNWNVIKCDTSAVTCKRPDDARLYSGAEIMTHENLSMTHVGAYSRNDVSVDAWETPVRK